MDYLIFFGILISVSSCNTRLNCPSGILDCDKEILGSVLNSDICECVCSEVYPGGIYTSLIDGKAFCWRESSTDYSTDYEIYGFDHHHVRSDGFAERVLGAIKIYYDVDGYLLSQREDIPYQGQANFLLQFPLSGPNSCSKPSNFENLQPFYMKENKRDTLFMDQLVGFWFPNTHVICGEFYFTKSYMVRRDEGLDWYSDLYGVPEGEDFVAIRLAAHYGEIEPDTTFFIHMPLLFKKG